MKKIFSIEHLYDAVSANYNAEEACNEGVPMTWQEYNSGDLSDERDDLYDSLSQKEKKDFESQLHKTTQIQLSKFRQLESLNQNDYPDEESFFMDRQEIIDEIKDSIATNFNDFLQ